MELMQANHQWASRPADQRYVSLTDMLEAQRLERQRSRALVVASRKIEVLPQEDHKGLSIRGPSGGEAAPTHWAFGQLCQLAEAPAGYLRTMPAEIVADCLNWGLQYKREVEDVGLLLTRQVDDNSARLSVEARAATGPRYGRVWNSEITEGLVQRFGNGVTDSDWRVPGEFGKAITVTRENTTLFSGDRSMFVFLADERNRIELPARRDGKTGTLARGFFAWNSEVGDCTLGVATFLFDYACCNRIVWGANRFRQIKLRHTPKAPVRWLDEVAPALESYRQGRASDIVKAIEDARQKRLDDPTEFLTKRFGKKMPAVLQDICVEEEGHPIQTLWDAATAVTAYARRIQWQDERVALETKAGEILDLAA